MPRPLMQHGVGQLEEMFAKGKSDPKVLKNLELELQYRQVPRAVALLAEVQAVCTAVPLQHPKLQRPLINPQGHRLRRQSNRAYGSGHHRQSPPRGPLLRSPGQWRLRSARQWRGLSHRRCR